jgi:hypothetical protein
MIELILNTKFLFFPSHKCFTFPPRCDNKRIRKSRKFFGSIFRVCVQWWGGRPLRHTHTAQYVTPGAGPPLHNSILSPSTLLCAQCKTSVCVTADWKSGRLSDLHGDTALKNDVCNRVGWWTQWLHLLPTVWSIGNGQKIRSTRLMGRRFSSSQTHTHSSTTPLYRLFSLTNIHTRWLAGWAHTQLTLYTLAAPTHTGRLMPRLFYRTSPPLIFRPSCLCARAINSPRGVANGCLDGGHGDWVGRR